MLFFMAVPQDSRFAKHLNYDLVFKSIVAKVSSLNASRRKMHFSYPQRKAKLPSIEAEKS